MALGSTQPVTEMSTRNLPGNKGQLACKADSLTTICEPIVQKIWEPRCLTTPCVSMSCYTNSHTCFIVESPFNVPRFKAFVHLIFSFNVTKQDHNFSDKDFLAFLFKSTGPIKCGFHYLKGKYLDSEFTRTCLFYFMYFVVLYLIILMKLLWA
jgi:hypothetical protein